MFFRQTRRSSLAGVTPGLIPVLAIGVDHAAVSLEELVRHLEDRKHQAALRTPGDMAAVRLAPYELAGLAFDTLRRPFLVDERALQHIGLLDIDVLMIWQHGARGEAHQGRHQPGLAIEQKRLGFATGKARLLPFHVLRLNEMRMRLGSSWTLRRDGIHDGSPCDF